MTDSTLRKVIRRNRHSLLGLTAGLSLASAPVFGQGPPPLPESAAFVPPAAETVQAPPAPALPPFGGSILERPKLSGDWLGLRSELRDCGFTFDASATGYYQGVTSGGIQDGFRFSGRADYLLDVDGHKAGLWEGFFVNLHGESVFGQSVNSFTGAVMPVNTGRLVPVPDQSLTALTGVKFTQALSENFAVFAGKINTFDDIHQPFLPGRGIDAGFMNLANIINPVLARTVPYSTLGAGAAILLEGQPVAVLMVLDTHDSSTVTGFSNLFDNGATIVATGGLPSKFFGMPGTHAFTGTYSSGKYAETDGDNYTLVALLLRARLGLPLVKKVRGSWSIVYQGTQTVWTDPCNAKRSWGLFGGAGISDGNPNPIRWSGNIGVAGSSLIPGREGDTFGAAYFYVGLSDSFKNIAPRLLPLRDEQGVEVFYNAALTPWCHVAPNLQVVNPARSNFTTDVVFGLRAKIDF